MKKNIFIVLILTAFIFSVFVVASDAATVASGISKYKRKNYVGCLQDMQEVIKRDPSNVAAYYYLGLSNAQLGMKDEAKNAYEKVESLSTNAKLKEYATKGKGCIDNPDSCKMNLTDEETLLKSGKFASPKAEKTLKEMEAERAIKEINRNADKIKSDAAVNTNQNVAVKPTKEEVANALDTLARAGINPYTNNTNSDLMQLNMMLGNGNNQPNQNNNYFNMLPYLQNQQASGQKIKPEVMQAMMMQSMMGNMNYGY